MHLYEHTHSTPYMNNKKLRHTSLKNPVITVYENKVSVNDLLLCVFLPSQQELLVCSVEMSEDYIFGWL